MSRYSRFVFLSGVILFVLLASLAHPMAVYADDGTPPPPATEEPVLPPTEEEGGAEALPPATEEPVQPSTEEDGGTDAPPLATEEVVSPPAAEPDVELPATEEGTVGELLTAGGESTEIVVLDENRNVLPLVSKQAVAVVTTVGPMWCPAGVQPGGTGCSAQFASPQALIDDMGANPTNYNQDGIIYFTADSGGAFILASGSGALDVADYDALKGNDLILQGGWSGTNGDTSFAQTNFGANVVQTGDDMNPWAGNITIKNITINGAGTTGLVVITEGDINLNKVNSSGNGDNGAYLDNCALDPNTEECLGSGSIAVTSGTFNGNGSNGIEACSTGNVTLTGVKADGNGDVGLVAYSDGTLMLSNVTANGNLGERGGAVLDSVSGVDVRDSEFRENHGSGLQALSLNSIKLSNVIANDNGDYGAILLNMSFFAGDFDISISNSHFDGNQAAFVPGSDLPPAGLLVWSFGGDVKLDTVSASNNPNGYGSFILTFSDLLIKDSAFHENGLGGSMFMSAGDATIICSQFKNNSGVGVDGFDVGGIFTLNDVTFSGNTVDYDGTPVFMSGGCKIVKGKEHKASTALPLHIVPVSGGEQIELDCKSYSGTKLILPNGDRVTLPCPIHDTGILTGKTADQLPAPLNAPFDFASALEVQVIRNGEALSRVNIGMTIDFTISDGQQGADFTILRWDAEASQWVDVSGGMQTGDGHFVATSNFTGIYVLVTK